MLTFEIPAYISVDIETTGPMPGHYSLISIGACTVSKPRKSFFVELSAVANPNNNEVTATVPELPDEKKGNGLPPEEAMRNFSLWIENSVPPNIKPILVAFNAPFEWMFINYYFYTYLGHNPFGSSALDIKAFYMGARRTSWLQTSFQEVSHHYMEDISPSHNTLQDAIEQAALFNKIIMSTARER